MAYAVGMVPFVGMTWYHQDDAMHDMNGVILVKLKDAMAQCN